MLELIAYFNRKRVWQGVGRG